MAEGVHKITQTFEQELCRYTGAPYCVAVDNCSNALYLALKYHGIEGLEIETPSHTYPSVPCEIIRAGGMPAFTASDSILSGAYQLKPTPVYDSALRFTYGMYIRGSYMCLSFTGPFKHLKLGKAGAILTDDYDAYQWFKRSRFSGRREMSYHHDNLDMLGINCYLMPEIAARGLLLIQQFYKQDGSPIANPDLALPYPDLSKFEVYRCSKK